MDSFFAHAKAITGINFETSLQSGEACQSWNRWPFATFGGQITHWLFVQCTVFSRVFAALEWSFHLAWGQLSKFLTSDTFTAAAAKRMCLWKHWSLMGYMGFVGRTVCRMGMRAWNTILAAGFELITMLLTFLKLPAPKAIPATPDPVCNLALGKLTSLHRVFQELPTFMFGIVCDVLLRGGRYAFALYSEVGLKVLDLAIQTLNGEGDIFALMTQILVELTSTLDPAALFDMMSGGSSISTDSFNQAPPSEKTAQTAVLEVGAERAEAPALKKLAGVFGLPSELSSLVIDVVKPAVAALFRYQELQGALAGAFVLTTGFAATMSSPNGKKDPNKKTEPKKKTALLEVGAARSHTGRTAATSRRSRALSRSGAAPGGTKTIWDTGQKGSFEEMGFGVGGPGPVEESYPYHLKIHSPMSHTAVNGAGVGSLTDNLAMCVKRQYKLKKASISSSDDVTRVNDAMKVCRACKTSEEKHTSTLSTKCHTKPGPAARFNWPSSGECATCQNFGKVDPKTKKFEGGGVYDFTVHAIELAKKVDDAKADEESKCQTGLEASKPCTAAKSKTEKAYATRLADHIGRSKSCKTLCTILQGTTMTEPGHPSPFLSQCKAKNAGANEPVKTECESLSGVRQKDLFKSFLKGRDEQCVNAIPGGKKCSYKVNSATCTCEAPCKPADKNTCEQLQLVSSFDFIKNEVDASKGACEKKRNKADTLLCKNPVVYKKLGTTVYTGTAVPGTYQLELDITDSSAITKKKTVTLARLTQEAGGMRWEQSNTNHGTGNGVEWSADGGTTTSLPSDHIKFWLEQGYAQAAACWEAAGYEIVVEMVLDPGCGEEEGSPETINDEEFTMEALDKCVDMDVQIGDIFTNLMSPESLVSKKLFTGKDSSAEKEEKKKTAADALKNSDEKEGKLVCWMKEKLGGPEEVMIDVNKSLRKQLKQEVALTMRICNLDSLNYNDLVDPTTLAIRIGNTDARKTAEATAKKKDVKAKKDQKTAESKLSEATAKKKAIVSKAIADKTDKPDDTKYRALYKLLKNEAATAKWKASLAAEVLKDATANLEKGITSSSSLTWDDLLRKRRPFYGMFEKTQFDQTISRTNFGEYGFSVEMQVSLLGEGGFMAKIFGGVSKKLNRFVKKGLKLSSSATQVTGMLQGLVETNLQLSITRNKYGSCDIILDVTSFHNNEAAKGFARFYRKLNAKDDIPTHAFHLFSWFVSDYNAKTNQVKRQTVLFFTDVIDTYETSAGRITDVGRTDRAKLEVVTKMSLSVVVKLLLSVLEHTQDHDKQGGDQCQKMQKRNHKKQKAKDSKKTAEEDKKKLDEWQDKHTKTTEEDKKKLDEHKKTAEEDKKKLDEHTERKEVKACESSGTQKLMEKYCNGLKADEKVLEEKLKASKADEKDLEEKLKALKEDEQDLKDKHTASQETAGAHKKEYDTQFDTDELEKRYKEIERRTAGKCNTNVGKAANKPDCDKLQEANDKFEEKKKEVEEQEKTDEQTRLDAVEGGLKTNTANIRKADEDAQKGIADQESRLVDKNKDDVASLNKKIATDKAATEKAISELKATQGGDKAEKAEMHKKIKTLEEEHRVQSGKLKAEADKVKYLKRDKKARDDAQKAGWIKSLGLVAAPKEKKTFLLTEKDPRKR